MKKSYTPIQVIILIVIVVVIAFAIVHNYNKNKQAPVVTPVQVTTTEPSATVSYSCDAGKTITAVYYQGESTPSADPSQPPIPGGSVTVTLSDGRTMTLKQTISADGTRYANADESFVFWGKGNGALVLENNQSKSYIGCIQVALAPADGSLPQVYSNSSEGFSLRLPSLATTANSNGYKVDASYKYQNLGPGKDIYGVKFTIPASLAKGTNLSTDSYISVEEIPKATTCTASLFTDQGTKATTVTDNGVTYSQIITGDAGAGNRYDETIYAIPGTSPCVAVRYFIHYGAFENYPAESITQFDKQALISTFDQIRRTLVINQ